MIVFRDFGSRAAACPLHSRQLWRLLREPPRSDLSLWELPERWSPRKFTQTWRWGGEARLPQAPEKETRLWPWPPGAPAVAPSEIHALRCHGERFRGPSTGGGLPYL